MRQVPFSRSLLIERSDFDEFANKKYFRFKGVGSKAPPPAPPPLRFHVSLPRPPLPLRAAVKSVSARGLAVGRSGSGSGTCWSSTRSCAGRTARRSSCAARTCPAPRWGARCPTGRRSRASSTGSLSRTPRAPPSGCTTACSPRPSRAPATRRVCATSSRPLHRTFSEPALGAVL